MSLRDLIPFDLAQLVKNLAALLAGTDLSAIDSHVRADLVTAIGTKPDELIEADADIDKIKGQLSAAVATVLAKPDVREKLLAIGLIPVGSTPEELSRELGANTAFWQPIVKATGYRITD